MNLIFWILAATTLDFSNGVSGSWLFMVYVAPMILPLAPFIEQQSNHPGFFMLVGALALILLPLFWSAVVYGVVRLIRKFLKKSV